MAGRQLYSLAADEGQATASVASTSLDAFGAVKDVVLGSNPQVHYPPEYLVYEGLWLHAQLTPRQLCIRLPRDVDIAQGAEPRYFDADYHSVACAVDLLTDELVRDFTNAGLSLRPGVVVALLGIPSLHLVLHALALWRLDCAVQFFNHDLGADVMDSLLKASCTGGTAALLYAGLTRQEYSDLRLDGLQGRVGVRVMEVPRRLFTISLLDQVTKGAANSNGQQRTPRPPMQVERFVESSRSELVRLVTHTSGSSGTPKISRWDLFALGCFMRPPPHIQLSPQNRCFPYLQVSRPHWTTSCFLTTYGIASGTAMALCNPANRLYPTTKEALDMVASTQSKSLLLFPAQAIELRDLLQRDPAEYRPILESLASLQFIGASLDSISAQAIADLKIDDKVLVLNLHGLGEIGTTSLSTTRAPYNVLYSTSEAALFEPVALDDAERADTNDKGKDSGSVPQYVKLWIAMDKHPMLWYQLVQGRVPSLRVQRFPTPGPMLHRPALDTGDIFEVRKMDNGLTGYIHRARDDDIIRLSNLYRPNVTELEARLLQLLLQSRAADEGRALQFEDIDAVQIMGDGKARLAAVIQIKKASVTTKSLIHAAVNDAIAKFDIDVPAAVQIGSMGRVAIVLLDAQEQSSPRLLKTHKANLRRRRNTELWSSWLDRLPQ